MSTRTFCDRCGRECTPPRRCVIHLHEVHLTSDGGEVGTDDYRPADLCDLCTDVIKAGLGDALRVAEHYDTDSEMRVGSPVLVRQPEPLMADRLVMLPEEPRGAP